ncbi:hypothetical protein AVEN_179626-1 [Araneus ventricosus]|uniref:Uncharacterized protein n=1 Tax=Araneus ventricosus TaxID=182803 RepID=A0A4Y2BDM8_ARAVE|nr:hypothetical protein AVEN_179626-1 [Araneus ventricosus]
MGRGGLVIKSSLRRRWVPGSEPDLTEDRSRFRAWLTLKPTAWVKRPPSGVKRKFGKVVPAQVTSSSSDHLNRGSKLRGPSQNSPRIALEQDVNVIKLNLHENVTYDVRSKLILRRIVMCDITYFMSFITHQSSRLYTVKPVYNDIVET